MSAPARDLDKYRPNVGVVLFDKAGRVWLGRRARTPGPRNWQFPQGGVDPGEEFEPAARRELWEETGVISVSLLGQTDDWIVYDFPPEVLKGSKSFRGHLGQKQKWFAYRFEGQDSEIDLNAHQEVEFDAWRWAPIDEALDTVVPFKRSVYEAVLATFRGFAAPA